MPFVQISLAERGGCCALRPDEHGTRTYAIAGWGAVRGTRGVRSTKKPKLIVSAFVLG